MEEDGRCELRGRHWKIYTYCRICLMGYDEYVIFPLPLYSCTSYQRPICSQICTLSLLLVVSTYIATSGGAANWKVADTVEG